MKIQPKQIPLLLWKLLWAIPVYVSLFLFCVFISIFNLNIEDGYDFWKETV